MRALLAALLLVPLALGQPEVVDWIDARVEPFDEPIPPLQRPGVTRMTVRVSCLLAEGGGAATVPLAYAVREQPPWASVTISPSTDLAPVGECDAGYTAAREASVIVNVNDQAPGFTPTPLIVEVVAGAGQRERRESVHANVTASYFGILDVQLDDPMATIPPGGSHEFRASVTNFGNARTRVETSLSQAPTGATVALPPPLLLGSRQHGAADVAQEIAFRVTADPESGFVNRVTTFSVAFGSFYSEDDSYAGDSSTLSFLVTIRSGAGEGAQRLPVPGAALLAGLASVALAAALRRR